MRAAGSLALVLALAATAGCRRAADPPPRSGTAASAPDARVATAPAPAPAPPAVVEAVPDDPPLPVGRHIAILYSSNLRGEYEPCG